MPNKRVILANDSRLLREMLQRVLRKADHLEVQLIAASADLPSAIQRLEPEWVIVSASPGAQQPWMNACASRHPSVGFIFLSRDNRSIRVQREGVYEAAMPDLVLTDLIHVLERDLEHI